MVNDLKLKLSCIKRIFLMLKKDFYGWKLERNELDFNINVSYYDIS